MMQPKGRIFYFCTDTNQPFGGLKKIYNHVDVLNTFGFEAYVIHGVLGMRLDWFQNSTPIAYITGASEPLFVLEPALKTLTPFSREDILVIPELMAYKLAPYTLRNNLHIVIFNQNAYLTFQNLYLPSIPFNCEKDNEEFMPYFGKNLLGIIAVSEDNQEYLQYAFPHLAIHRIRNTLNFDVFQYQSKKKKQIAYMARMHKEKTMMNRDDYCQVIFMLKERGFLEDWKLFPIENMPESQVAEALKESALFLSFSYEEGCPLPPQEAMACGCIVIGYDGEGGKEFIKEPFAYPIPHGKNVLFSKTVETVAREYEKNPSRFEAQVVLACENIKKNYSAEYESEDLKHAWRAIIKAHHIALKTPK